MKGIAVFRICRSLFAVILSLTWVFGATGQVADASHKSGLGTYSDGPWTIWYSITNTDGLLINHATWYGVDNFKDMKLPQVTVEYISTANTQIIIDQLGWTANNPPCPSGVQFVDLYDGGNKAGFELKIEFRTVTSTCGVFPPDPNQPNYTYVQVYDFWYNGVVVPILRIYGPGMYPTSAPDSRYHVYYRLDLSAGGTNGDDFFEYWAINTTQYPPYEHDFHDDEVYNPPTTGYEWVNRDGAPYFKGYTSKPWIYSAWTAPPPNQNDYWTFVYVSGEQEQAGSPYDTEKKEFTNFPKTWDNNQQIYTAQDMVNWFVSTVQSSDNPSYCKPSNQCGVGIWFTPLNQ